MAARHQGAGVDNAEQPMRPTGWFLLLFISAFLGTASAQPATVITGATLIDGTGGAPIRDAVIVVDGRKIMAAGPRGRVTIPAGASVDEVAGKYVIPG